MSSLLIEGGRAISGTIEVEGRAAQGHRPHHHAVRSRCTSRAREGGGAPGQRDEAIDLPERRRQRVVQSSDAGRGSREVDGRLIDGVFVNGAARLVDFTAGLVRRMQTGYLYHYAFAMIFGILLLLTLMVFGL